MAGCLRQSQTLPTDEGAPFTFTDPETLFASAPHRFTARAPRAVSKHAEQLWADALKQVDEGWLTPPEPLDENGRFLDRPRGVVISLLDSESNKPTNCEGATI